MTKATLTALVAVYSTLIKAGWDDEPEGTDDRATWAASGAERGSSSSRDQDAPDCHYEASVGRGEPVERLLIAGIAFVQSLLLLVAGLATILMSQSLMLWLIRLVGYERALGAESVVRTKEGGTLLTNPGAMMLWMTPFLLFGALQVSSAFTLGWFGYRHLRSRPAGLASSGTTRQPNRWTT